MLFHYHARMSYLCFQVGNHTGGGIACYCERVGNSLPWSKVCIERPFDYVVSQRLPEKSL